MAQNQTDTESGAVDADPIERPALLDARGILRAAFGVVALLTLMLTAFAWPTSELEPRSLPIAVAAPSTQAAEGVENRLTSAFGEDGIDVVEVADRASAVEAITEREAYGAIVVGAEGTEILTAGAASPLVAQLIGGAAQAMDAQQGSPPPVVTDVVPAAEGDPRGAVFSAGALPLALGGVLAGAISSLLLTRIRDRVAAAVLAATGAGLALTGVLQGGLDALGGSYWANAAMVALGVLAVALPVVGVHRLIGRPGIILIALLVMLVGNPLSGLATSPDMLPLGWLGQLMPPGASGTALRGTAFFGGAGIGAPLVVLSCWAVVGLGLALIPRRTAPGGVGTVPPASSEA